MLYQKQNVLAVGYPNWNSTVWMNIGSMQARGWELGLSWRDKSAKTSRMTLVSTCLPYATKPSASRVTVL